MAIVYRSVKGSNLTAAEVDGNFSDLDGRVAALESDFGSGRSIDSITQNGNVLYITLEDGTVFGPFVLPTVRFQWQGDWVGNTAYNVNDMFRVSDDGADDGIYLVLEAHTSETTFDPDLTVGSGSDDAYLLLLSTVRATGPGAWCNGISTKSGSTYTLAEADANTFINFTGTPSGNIVVTLPDDASQDFGNGTLFGICQAQGSSQVELSVPSGVTLNYNSTYHNPYTAREWSVVYALKSGDNEWTIFGDLDVV